MDIRFYTHSMPLKTRKWYYTANWQEDGSGNPVEYTISCSVHEICHSSAIFQIWIKMSYSGCSRLCESLIMDWRQYFCHLLSIMTAVGELNIKLNSCQSDKYLEVVLFHWNDHFLCSFLWRRENVSFISLSILYGCWWNIAIRKRCYNWHPETFYWSVVSHCKITENNVLLSGFIIKTEF